MSKEDFIPMNRLSRKKSPAVGIIAAMLIAFTGVSVLPDHAKAATAPFGFTGGVQTWTVPLGVTSITVDIQGAQGGDGSGSSLSGRGGKGARVQSTIPVTPGEVLSIYVGGTGSAGSNGGAGGFNGGGSTGGVGTRAGGGGGASDIRRGGTRIIVAGGGGGAGPIPYATNGGAGGQFGTKGGDGVSGSPAPCGFKTTGGCKGIGGNGATGISGGSGGAGGDGWKKGKNGQAGTPGFGGKGGDSNTVTVGGESPGSPGGGGGGGYYGGGGGGAGGNCGPGPTSPGHGAGGGGGSSFSSGSGTTYTSGFSSGNGAVTITYVDDTTPPTGTIVINSGAAFTTTTAVTLVLSCSDAGSGCSQMRFSNDNVAFSSPQSFATSKSWTLTSGDGTKTVFVQYKDTAGNWSGSFSDTIVLDTTPPDVSFDSPAVSSWQIGDFTVQYDATDTNISSCKLFTNNGGAGWVDRGATSCGTDQTRIIDISAWCTAEGLDKCGARIWAQDAAGNTAQADRPFSIDTTPPIVSISSPAAGSWQNADFTVGYSATDASLCKLFTNNAGAGWVDRGTTTCGVGQTKTIDISAWCTVEGLNKCGVRIWARDIPGNTAQADRSFSIDTIPPNTVIDPPVPANPTSSTSAIFTFHSTEAGSTFECELDSGGFSPCTSPKSYSGLADGSHIFKVRAIDIAGNKDPSPAFFTWIVDTAPPDTIIDTFPLDPTNLTSAEFTFHSTEAGSTFECRLDSGAWSSCTTPKSYSSLPQGSHKFEVRAIDIAANKDPSPAFFTWIVDLTAPTVTDFKVNGLAKPAVVITSSAAAISWTATDTGGAGIDHIELWRAPDAGGVPGVWTKVGADMAAGTTSTTDTPPADGAWWYGIHVLDKTQPTKNCITEAGGHCGGVTSDSLDVRTNRGPIKVIFDTTPPDTIIDPPLPADPTNITSATFFFHSTEAGSTFECELVGVEAFTSCTSPKSYSAIPEGAREFLVRATDVAGNTDPTPASFTWMIDITAPVVTEFLLDGVGKPPGEVFVNSTTTITWKVDDGAGSGIDRVELWRATDSGGVPGLWTLLDPDATSGDTDNPPDGTWWYGIHVIDRAGNCITEAGGHCGGVLSDSADMPPGRPDLGPMKLIMDRFPPEVSFDNPDKGDWFSDDFFVQYDAEDPNINTCKLFTNENLTGWADRGEIDCGDSETEKIDISEWCAVPGEETCGVRIWADDKGGNTAQADRFFSINTPPFVDAGDYPPVPMALPDVTVSLDGTVFDDGFPVPPGALIIEWKQVSGPAGKATFTSPFSEDTDVTFEASGVYALRLSANDGLVTVSDTTFITILNAQPIADAGPPVLEIPFAFPISLAGSAADDGLPDPPSELDVTWSRIEGPGTETITDEKSLSTDVKLSQAGVHKFLLEVSDGELVGSDIIEVQYGAPPGYSLVPCGVIIDDPETEWFETDPCELKHTLLLIRNVLNFALWNLIPWIIALLVIATGVIFYFSLGSETTLILVRRIWRAVVIGLLIMLFSWVLLNIFLSLAGFNIDVFGRWYEVKVE